MARPVESGKYSRFILLASACVIIAGLYFGREVLMPISLAVLLSFLLTPAVSRLERWRFPRPAAVLIVVLIAVGAIGSIGYLVYHQTVTILDELPKYRGQLESKLSSIRRPGVFGKAEQEIKGITEAGKPNPSAHAQPPPLAPGLLPESGATFDATSPRAATPRAPVTQPSAENPLPVQVIQHITPLEMLKNYAARFLDPLATAGLVLVFIIFMLLQREDLRDRVIKLIGRGRLNVTTQALDEAATRISKYLGALAIVNGLYALVTAVGLWVIGHFLGHGHGFPNVLVWGILVGLFRFVPYIGIWIGAAFPLALSFALFPGYGVFFAVVGLFVALEVVVSQFVEPFWYGASTGMSALAVLVAAVFWTWLWGPVGLLLSTPLTVCLVVMGKYVPQLEFLDILLRDEPVLEPHVRIYQRLIAEDPEEATDLANQYAEERSLEEVYDQILIPSLSLAEHDRHRGRLDEDRYNALLQGMHDIVEELGDQERATRTQNAAEATVEAAKNVPGGTVVVQKRAGQRLPSLPKDCTVNILCLPARAQADEIVAMMLSQLLELRGYCAILVSTDSLAAEMLDMVEKKRADVVCVSAMPPAAVSHARYLCKRLNARYNDLRTVIGLWTLKADLKRAKQRISCSDSVQIATTLAEAQNEIEELAHPLVAGATNAEAKEPAAIGR